MWANLTLPIAMYRRAKSMEKSLNRIKRLDKPILNSKNMKMELEDATRVSNRVIEMEDVTKTYDKLLFEKVNMLVRRGEHIAIIGDNGTGKSTLLKIILESFQLITVLLKRQTT